MTGQSLLDRMELLNEELQLQSGEANVTRGLTALNVAQDYFETLAAQRGKIFGSKTGTLMTTPQYETTAFPTGVLRIDRLQLLDTTTQRPKWDLDRIARAGGHVNPSYWPYNLVTPSTVTGEPRGYWTDGTQIYWNPLPSDTSCCVRWYGFQRANDITASGTFAYPDGVALPLAAFAVRLFKTGVDDPGTDSGGLATEAFGQVLDQMSLFNRDGATPFEYTQIHNT